MSKDKPKTTNGLMNYLRVEKGINIGGSIQKRKLMNMGYYHGYKGYRYINGPTNRIQYSDFEELLAIYNYDSQIKALLYPAVMIIETALKNYVLEILVSKTKSDSFLDIYNQLLDNYKMFSTKGRTYPNREKRRVAEEQYKRQLKRRLDLRNRIYSVQTNAFGNGNKIANHYLQNDLNMPIWGIFELLSLGEFGHFVSCLNYDTRKAFSVKLDIKQSDDNNAMLPQRLIYSIKDLRNAIAHNDVVFDTRFSNGSKIDKQVSNALTNATGVKNITFKTITDYLVLIIYILKALKVTKTEMKRIVNNFQEITDELRNKIPTNVYNRIVYTDYTNKLMQLRKFISK